MLFDVLDTEKCPACGGVATQPASETLPQLYRCTDCGTDFLTPED